VDDPRLDPFGRVAAPFSGRLGRWPVIPHHLDTGKPLHPHGQEQRALTKSLMSNPSWSFHGAKIPQQADPARPGTSTSSRSIRTTTFIACTSPNWPENLDAVSPGSTNTPIVRGIRCSRADWPPAAPRTQISSSIIRTASCSEPPDSDPEEAMYANYFRWLETPDEYFAYAALSGTRALGNLRNGTPG